MNNCIPHSRSRGIIFAEVIICIPIMGLLMALAVSGVTSYQHSRNAFAARREAAWAAAAQLQRFQAGAALDSQPPADVIPAEVVLKTLTVPGQGPWQGFQLISVSATIRLNAREQVTETMRGYLRAEAKP